jgi:DNA replication protein DnaD
MQNDTQSCRKFRFLLQNDTQSDKIRQNQTKNRKDNEMDENLENLVKKIIKTKQTTQNITNAKCFKKHFNEIKDILEDRSVKTYFKW